MKTKGYRNDEVPHLWIHETQPEAHGNRMFFEGESIYSYGHHFEIARIVKRKGKAKCVLFNTGNYSLTTATHKNYVLDAIPKDIPVYSVPSFTDQKKNWEDYKYRVAALELKCSRARSNADWLLESLERLIEEANRYKAHFGIRGKRIAIPDMGEVKERAKAHAAAKKKQTQERARLRKEYIRWVEESRLPLWRNHEDYSSIRIPDKFKPNLPFYPLPDRLRLSIDGTEVETSKGARVPVDHARKACRIIKKLVASGKTYKHNGHTIHVGHYRIDSIDQQGTVRAGCHVIPYSEIEYISSAIEWIRGDTQLPDGEIERS